MNESRENEKKDKKKEQMREGKDVMGWQKEREW